MLKPHGYTIGVNREGKTVFETDTIQCGHCNAHFNIKPNQTKDDLGGGCRVCMSFICGPCVDLGRCIPFEKQIDQAEARARMLKSVGL